MFLFPCLKYREGLPLQQLIVLSNGVEKIPPDKCFSHFQSKNSCTFGNGHQNGGIECTIDIHQWIFVFKTFFKYWWERHCLLLEGLWNDRYLPFMTVQTMNIHRSMSNDMYIHQNFNCKACPLWFAFLEYFSNFCITWLSYAQGLIFHLIMWRALEPSATPRHILSFSLK